MRKRIIWLTGGMASGKSTQRRMLCNAFQTEEPKEIKGTENGLNYHYTSFGEVSCIGKVKQVDNGDISMCDGLDSVFGNVKKDGGLYSVKKALQSSTIVVLEGSQTSPSWAELMQKTMKEENAELFLVHLYLSYWENFLRLIKRQGDKEELKGKAIQPDDLHPIYKGITDKNIESLIGKCRQFNNCFDKVQHLVKPVKIICGEKTPEQIFEEILEQCFYDID